MTNTQTNNDELGYVSYQTGDKYTYVPTDNIITKKGVEQDIFKYMNPLFETFEEAVENKPPHHIVVTVRPTDNGLSEILTSVRIDIDMVALQNFYNNVKMLEDIENGGALIIKLGTQILLLMELKQGVHETNLEGLVGYYDLYNSLKDLSYNDMLDLNDVSKRLSKEFDLYHNGRQTVKEV